MTEKVWLKFEVNTKDGRFLKLRIQDLPKDKIDDAIDLMLKYYTTEEAVNKAAGMAKNPVTVERRRNFYRDRFNTPTYHTVLCCSDDSDSVQDIMGLSIMNCSTNVMAWIEKAKSEEVLMTEEEKKLFAIIADYFSKYDPVKIFNLDKYYMDNGLVVAAAYRRLGIAEHFFKVRRLICEAAGIKMTGGWMTSLGTQIAAARDGWVTVCELDFDSLAKKYDVTFVDTPPTMKFMLAKIKK